MHNVFSSKGMCTKSRGLFKFWKISNASKTCQLSLTCRYYCYVAYMSCLITNAICLCFILYLFFA